MFVNLWDDIIIQSYKHNTKLHRIWAHATVIDQTVDTIVIANYRTKVIESNGRFWYTREPSVTWFFKNHWFNVIGIIRPTGIFYYCNIASPYMIDEEALKYIDYDLDIKVSPDYSYSILDRKEYNKHKVKMEYPHALSRILESELGVLKRLIEAHQGPFKDGQVEYYYHQYKEKVFDDDSKPTLED